MKKLLILCFVSLLCFNLYAQENGEKENYFGIGFGFHSNKMKYTNIGNRFFSEKKSLKGALFSLYVQQQLGMSGRFAMRPEIAFLKRGGEMRGSYSFLKSANGSANTTYKLKANYIDIRLPFMYYLSNNGRLRPYVLVAPVLGFARKGNIKLNEDYYDGTNDAVEMKLTEANMAKAYFALSAGVGMNYSFNISDHNFLVGVEAIYEHGLSNTYSKMEKDGTSVDILSSGRVVDGKRRFRGFELKATLGIPFSVFKKREEKSEPIEIAPAPRKVVTVAVQEKDCYSLEEIEYMIQNGEKVDGKTICAIDAIHFDFSKSTIKPTSYDFLNKLSSVLIKLNRKIEVKGHTDNVGTDEFNMKLSKERAEVVVKYLIEHGVNKELLSYSFWGESKPLQSNDTEAGRTVNRRVEFEILNN